jgi:aminotransferase
VHDFLTVGAAAPLQQASAVVLETGHKYYTHLSTDYAKRRDKLLTVLEAAGFRCFRPKGAYYIMTDISAFGFTDDLAFARYLLSEVGVIGVPGSSFYADPRDGSQQMRFCFCKKLETLEAASECFSKLRRPF